MQEDFDCRDVWVGIQSIKEGYSPTPYRSVTEGNHIQKNKVAEESAKRLAKQQRGGTQANEKWRTFCKDPIVTDTEQYEVGERYYG